ncbi:SGNH/GDSL hydrolase family protein [Actinocrinis puniceicyclus]|uniref:SGNH/GDSL hydrolase family protein n=1 Tax=Actinocrinis puniceicyclus TaxID=977794 RepID=A0A8J8BFY3_9ACTN|nr:SGNH/GDSL hydrolase family protein [Actinocrinis puniceicyclus]MBS2965184.1 SGNH/GDSL hydrolase family protein [Actinocrinis puniceicyclus]
MAMSSAKRAVAVAAVSGGGLTVLTGASIGLVMAEAKLARRAIGHAVEVPPRADGLFGAHLAARTIVTEPATGYAPADASPTSARSTAADRARAEERPLRFAMLGDSTAAGYGVERADQTPGALLAVALAAHVGRPLLYANVARVGACSDRLAEQVDALLADGPEHAPQVATIMIGANDVTHRLSPTESAAHLHDAVLRLRAAGCQVVVATCPDLGTIRPIQVPLRWLARRWSRRLAALQARAVHEAGGRSVPLGALLGPEFAARAELFGPDRFHPSAEGYATAAAAVLPALAAAVWQIARTGQAETPVAGGIPGTGLPPEDGEPPRPGPPTLTRQ